MNTTLLLQIFLLLNVFIIGALTVIAAQHAYAHFKPTPPPEKPHRPIAHGAHLPPEVRKHLLEMAQINFQTVLDHSAAELQHDLRTTSTQLNKHLEKLGNDIVSDEMKRYKTNLDELRHHAETAIGGAQTYIAEHQAKLKAKLDERQSELEAKLTERQTELETKLNDEIVAEKQRLTQQLDTKLADAVASFLIETLQHNVDLGAQSAYLTAMLEEHKSEIIKGVTGEA